MTDVQRPAEFTVTLSEDQRRTVLNGLTNELLDTKRYLSGPPPAATPGPLDDCCDAHRARWQRDVDVRSSLTARLEHVNETIAQFLHEGETL